MPFSAWYLYDSGFFSTSSFYRGLLFTNFDSVYFRFDLTLFNFRLLNFVIEIPSYGRVSRKMNRVSNSRVGASLEPEPVLGSWTHQNSDRLEARSRSNFAEQHRSSRVQAPIRHKVLRGIKCPWLTSATKKLMNGRDSFLSKAEENWICGRLEYVSAITKSSIKKGSKLRNVAVSEKKNSG